MVSTRLELDVRAALRCAASAWGIDKNTGMVRTTG
jgi:hypothetical protein